MQQVDDRQAELDRLRWWIKKYELRLETVRRLLTVVEDPFERDRLLFERRDLRERIYMKRSLGRFLLKQDVQSKSNLIE